MTHPIIEDLQWRYTSKNYDPSRKVSQEDLDVFLEALRLSASSINSQPWKFIVLESDDAKMRMHNTFANKYQFNQPHIMEGSHVILFAHHPRYTRDDYAKVVDQGIADKRTPAENREKAFGSFIFAERNTDSEGNTANWTKTQVYIALGNALHTLARLKIDSTSMEGIDFDLVNEEFAKELGDYRCELALVIGYHHPSEDHNAKLPKSRLTKESVITKL